MAAGVLMMIVGISYGSIKLSTIKKRLKNGILENKKE
jgi:hypothetical protein